ncbi:MAG: GHKL domain-containing protein [Lachnospiraceae bacterium]|nr:GHKL domain-containing protein [Lachnospiraceae bacterium]
MVFLMKVNQQINLENITSSLSGFMVSILSQVVLISLVFTIIRISKKDELLTDQTWIKLSIMPVISILCITAMYINFTESSTDHQKNTILLLSIVFIFINLYVYYLVYEVAAGKEAEGKARLLKEKNNQIYKSYIETVGNYKYIRKKEHEYQNILLALLALAKEDNNEEIINVVEKELDIKDDREYHFDTNNSVTNLIFNHMYHVAEEKNILLSYKFNDLSKIPLSERDIAVLYCNLIKNSIEACDKLAEKRRIFVSSHCQESNFILKIENQFDGQLRQDNNKLFSINKNPDEHGYGLENIKEIVTKYDGFLTNEIDGNLFRIVIVIPIENYERDRKI